MKIEWRTEKELIPYPSAIAQMEERVAAIKAGNASELVWLLEHPPLYTAGSSAKGEDFLIPQGSPNSLPVFETGRGGQYTYHGPGQRIAYVMLDLTKRGNDIRCFIHDLEEGIIRTLAHFGVKGERRDGRVGVWVVRGKHREDKIAAIGVRVRRWITYHGVAINIRPDLSYYSGIVPCGIRSNQKQSFGVTSLFDLGLDINMDDVDLILKSEYITLFENNQKPASQVEI